MELLAANPRVDPPLRTYGDVLVRLDWDVTLVEDGSVLISEDVTAVELAYVLTKWVEADAWDRPPFEFDSMDDERVGLIAIQPEGNKWRVGSCLLPGDHWPLGSSSEVDCLVLSFIASVVSSTRIACGVDLQPLLSGQVICNDLLN